MSALKFYMKASKNYRSPLFFQNREAYKATNVCCYRIGYNKRNIQSWTVI